MKRYLQIIIISLFGFSKSALAQNFNSQTDLPFEETLEATVADVLEDSETTLSGGE